MLSFGETLALSAVIGFSVYLSLPIFLRRDTNEIATRLLNAVAIGILIFLMGDVFSDVSTLLYNHSLYGYGSSFFPDLAFFVSFAVGFLMLYYAENRSRISALTATQLALIIALAMGFQNLTEGLVFGSLGVSFGLSGAALVVLIGFFLQNLTEGFPIVSPFLGRTEGKLAVMLGLFFIGGIPTIIGGAVGYFYNGTILDVAFDGLAIGTILYAILPMLRSLLREVDPVKQRICYFGIFLGFIIGFLVNLI